MANQETICLGIPYPKGAALILYEHSMGQPGCLPPNVLRRTARRPARRTPAALEAA